MAKKITDPEAHLEAAEAFDKFIKTYEKKHPGSVFKGDDESTRINVDVIPTGALSLDLALGCGGIPRGRITQIYGPESSGKTSTCLAIGAQAQKMGGTVGFIDAEFAFNKENAIGMGIDMSKLAISQPDSGLDAFRTAAAMCKSGAFDLVIIDSVAALLPESEVNDDTDQIGTDNRIGAHAALMSKGLRVLTPIVAKSKTAVVLINQIRMNPGGYGNPEILPGGQSLKFYSSVIIDIRSSASKKIKEKINGKETAVGQTVAATIRKNKMAPPMKTAEFELYFKSGISGETSLIDVAEELGVISRAGASYTEVATGERLAVGKGNLKDLLLEKPELKEKLTERVYAIMRNEAPEVREEPVEVPEDEEDIFADIFSSDEDDPTEE